jgi:NAD(P)-dependent dehydrogenase (short-subunit alcohol dehydrogenase family)
LEAAHKEIEAAGGQALVLPTDVAHPDQIEAAADAVEQRFGPIDIWINNAMVSVFSPIKEMTPDEFKRVTEVTYLGYVYGTMSALKRMLGRDRGVIVQVGSALAYRGIPLQGAYCGAKHAIQGFTDSLRCELLHDESKVKVVEVHMPALNTPQFSWVKSRLPRKPQPVPPIFQPEVAAEAIFWAAHHDRPEVYVGWPTVKAIVGNKIAPRLADWYLARNGYSSQQTDEPVESDRRDNLWEPVPGDHGAHGDFGARSLSSSWQFLLNKHKTGLTLAGLTAAAALLALVKDSRRT